MYDISFRLEIIDTRYSEEFLDSSNGNREENSQTKYL